MGGGGGSRPEDGTIYTLIVLIYVHFTIYIHLNCLMFHLYDSVCTTLHHRSDIPSISPHSLYLLHPGVFDDVRPWSFESLSAPSAACAASPQCRNVSTEHPSDAVASRDLGGAVAVELPGRPRSAWRMIPVDV